MNLVMTILTMTMIGIFFRMTLDLTALKILVMKEKGTLIERED